MLACAGFGAGLFAWQTLGIDALQQGGNVILIEAEPIGAADGGVWLFDGCQVACIYPAVNGMHADLSTIGDLFDCHGFSHFCTSKLTHLFTYTDYSICRTYISLLD